MDGIRGDGGEEAFSELTPPYSEEDGALEARLVEKFVWICPNHVPIRFYSSTVKRQLFTG